MNRLFDDKAERKAVFGWWRGLDYNRGGRARLRRVQSLDVLEHPEKPGDYTAQRSLIALEKALKEAGAVSVCRTRLAPVAALLAHVRSNVSGERSIATLFAGGSDGHTPLTERRFQRLLNCRDHDALHEELRRVLHQQGRQAPVVALARDVYAWDEAVRRKWARLYYNAMLTAEQSVGAPYQKFGVASHAWWGTLEEHPGERAALLRCHTMDEALLCKGYHRLRQYAKRCPKLKDKKPRMYARRLALVAIALAHVREDLHRLDEKNTYRPTTLAELAASSKKRVQALRKGHKAEQHSEAQVSEVRFRRLLKADTHADLHRPLVRVIRQVGQVADVARLAEDLFNWDEQRRWWADRYYDIALPPIKDEA